MAAEADDFEEVEVEGVLHQCVASADGVPGGAGEHADEFVVRVRGPEREGGVSELCADGDAEVEQKMYGDADGAAE